MSLPTLLRRPDTRLLARLGCIIALLGLACGCFVPNRYTAILSLSNQAYSFTYIGEMTMMATYSPQYADYEPWALARKIVEEFSRVIKERSQVKLETRLISPHVFQTNFLYVSNYDKPEACGLFNISINGNVLTVTSRAISQQEHEMIRLNNVPSEGKLCIKAFGTVLESNAHKAATIFDRCNTWNLKDLNEPIRLVVRYSKPIPLDGKLPREF